MRKKVALFIYFLTGLVIIGYELNRDKKILIDHVTFFNFFYFLVYVFTPIALYIQGPSLINDDMPYGVNYWGKNPFTPFIVLGAYAAFIFGYESAKTQKSRYQITWEIALSQKKILTYILLANLFIYIALAIYVSEFGSLSKAIALAQAYRSGDIPWHKYGFMQKFFSLNSLLLYYTFYKYFLEKNPKVKDYYLPLFLMALLFTLLVTVIQNSRGYFIFEISGLYVITAIYHKNYYLKYLLPTLVVAILFIMYGRFFFQSISTYFSDGWDAFVSAFNERVLISAQNKQSIIANFTHPIVSLETSLYHSGYDVPLRYFKDLYDAIIVVLPNEMLGIQEPKIRLMHTNTKLLLGEAKSIVLPGILGYFSYAGQVVGVIVGSFLYGLLGGYLHKLSLLLYNRYKASIIFIFIISLQYGYFVFRGVPEHILSEQFIFLVTLLFLSQKIVINLDPIVKKENSFVKML